MAEQISEVPSQPVQTPTSVVPERKSNLPTIVILLVAILLVGVGGVYVGIQIGKKQVSPNQQIFQPAVSTPIPTQIPEITNIPTFDETASWRTYRNDKYRFEFKYPISWKHIIKGEKDWPRNADEFMPEGFARSSQGYGPKSPITIIYSKSKVEDKTSEAYLWMNKDNFVMNGDSYSEERIYVDGILSTKRVGNLKGSNTNPECIDVVIPVEDNNNEIHFFYFNFQGEYTPGIFVAPNEFDQILSTFKFLE